MKEYAIKTRENAIKMLFTPSALDYTIVQIRENVISISGTDLIIDTVPLQSLKLITDRDKMEEEKEKEKEKAKAKAFGGGKYKNKKTTRK